MAAEASSSNHGSDTAATGPLVDDKSKEFTVTLPSLDGTYQVVARLKENADDAAQPPTLLSITRQAIGPPPQPASDVPNHQTHVILSTGSGHQQAASFYETVIAPLLSEIYASRFQQVQKHTTASPTTILDLTHSTFFPLANAGAPLRIILLSGDGGIVDLVNGLLSQAHSPAYLAPKIILIPLGTANALYHSINPTTDKDHPQTWGLHALSSPLARPLPLFCATFSPGARLLTPETQREEYIPLDTQSGAPTLHGAVVCSWGIHATLVADSDTPAYRQHGLARFKMAAENALFPQDGKRAHAYKGVVSVLPAAQQTDSHDTPFPDEKWQPLPTTSHTYLLSTLVSSLERTFTISPASKPLDDKLFVIHIPYTSGEETMRLLGLAYQGGKHVDEASVQYTEVSGLRIDFEEDDDEGEGEVGQENGRWRRICLDGKIIKVDKGGWAEVRKVGVGHASPSGSKDGQKKSRKACVDIVVRPDFASPFASPSPRLPSSSYPSSFPPSSAAAGQST